MLSFFRGSFIPRLSTDPFITIPWGTPANSGGAMKGDPSAAKSRMFDGCNGTGKKPCPFKAG